MKLYHGTTPEIIEPKIIKSDIGRDFGFGFYTTDIKEQAERWAVRRDNVGETISYVIQGIMRKDDALERLKFEKINNQIAFCSNKALMSLKYVNSYSLEVE